MLLVESYVKYRAALRASLRAEYGLSFREVGPVECADLVAWLPAGSALWRAVGGHLAITETDHLLRALDYRLQILAWMQTEDAKKRRNQPKPPAPIPYSGEADLVNAHAERQAAARRRRAT